MGIPFVGMILLGVLVAALVAGAYYLLTGRKNE